MRTFALALGFAAAQANYGSNVGGYGTTGHYDNSFGHGGHQDHAHEDHIYGYDSVVPDYDLDLATEQALLALIIVQVEAANQVRVDYLSDVKAKRVRRLLEIKNDNDKKINAPFDFQLRLLDEEEDDILQARNNAVRDSNDAYDDMEWRLDTLYDDIIGEQEIEVEKIKNALDRSLVDHKNVAKVFGALRIDWLNEIATDPVAFTTTPQPTVRDFDSYLGLFDDFHYDIGHGKGTGETAPLPTGPAVDGYRNRNDPRQTGPVGDWERDNGAKTWAYEMNGSRY